MTSTNIQLSNSTKIMLASIAGIMALFGGIKMGAASGTIEVAWTLLSMFCTLFVPLCVGGLIADHKKNVGQKQLMEVKRDGIQQIANRYNAVTDLLEQAYRDEKNSMPHSTRKKKAKLAQKYEEEYQKNHREFQRERKAYLNNFHSTGQSLQYLRYWKWVVSLGLIAQLAACGYTLGLDTADAPTATIQQVADRPSTDTKTWNADNLPIPYLQDKTRYVSNPDGVVTPQTEQVLNQWFAKLEDSLQVQSVVAIVNHVENDDPFRMAQDLGNNLGVGYQDRGLVIILAYADHAINISPGRSLEVYLTDAECARLQRHYVVPFMKAEQPDSGMIYLAEALYNRLQGKDMPVIYEEREQPDPLFPLFAIYMLIFGGWAVLGGHLYRRYAHPSGMGRLYGSPFASEVSKYTESHSGGAFFGGTGGSGGFGGGGGGSFGGGSFGGGSFGGGGATSRW